MGIIKGRSRKIQLQMAKEYNIKNPPNAGGGCLLTDPSFGRKTKDLFEHTDMPTINEIDLLKVGRHFRFDEITKLIVGRDHQENQTISALALPEDIILETETYMGPTSLLRGNKEHLEKAARITLRYSDAPKSGIHTVRTGTTQAQVSRAEPDDMESFRIL